MQDERGALGEKGSVLPCAVTLSTPRREQGQGKPWVATGHPHLGFENRVLGQRGIW